MTLQFNPYPILDPNQYRKPTLQQKLEPINEGIQNALQLYQQSRQNRLQDINEAIALQAHRRPDGSMDFDSATGIPSTSLGDTSKPAPTPLFSSALPQSQSAPRPLFASAGVSTEPDTSVSPSFQPTQNSPFGSPSAGSTSAPVSTEPSPSPQTPAPAPTPKPLFAQGNAQPSAQPNFDNMSPFERQNYLRGTQQRQQFQESQQNADPNSDLTKTKQTIAGKFIPGLDTSKMTGQQIDSLMPLLEKYGQAELTKQYRDALLSSKTAAAGTKQDQADQKRWDQIVKDTDPYKASSRSALGVATLGNQRADRAVPVLQNPNATNQDIATAIADIAGVFQGGAPTEAGVHQQEYNTLMGKFANLKTMITGQPSAPAVPEIKQHLIDLVSQLKDVNNRTIKDQLDYTEMAHPDLIAKNRDAWTKIRQKVGVDNPMPAPSGSQGGGGPQPGFTRIRASDGSLHDLPTNNLKAAQQRDPGLQVVQ